MTTAVIQVVNNVYALQHFLQPKDGMLFKTMGRVTPFDGKAQEFMYKEGDISVPDGMDVIDHVNKGGKFIAFKEEDLQGNGTSNINTGFEIQSGGGSGKNLIFNNDYNDIADGLSAVTISGGGNSANRNLIGYTEYKDTVFGDGVTNTWLTSFDISDVNDLDVYLFRADNVVVAMKSSATITQSGSKLHIKYPNDGHFVNDAVGGTEGTNPFLLSTQKLVFTKKTKEKNTISDCNFSGISYGYDNLIKTGVMQHASGAHQRVNGGDHNTIFGGSYHIINSGAYGAIYGGTYNEISSLGSGAIIVGGVLNKTLGTAGPSYILGGQSNTVNGAYATIVGGYANNVTGNGAVSLGRFNTINSADAFAANSSNNISSTNSAVFGYQNTITGTGYSFCAGRENTITSQYSNCFGYKNIVQSNYSTAFGYQAKSKYIGGLTQANGAISVVGDAQSTVVVLKAVTTDDVLSAFNTLVLSNNSTVFFDAMIVARRQDGLNDSAGYRIDGVIQNNNGVVTLSASNKTVIHEDSVNFDVSVVAVSGGISLQIKGENSKTVYWVARVTLVEVTT